MIPVRIGPPYTQTLAFLHPRSSTVLSRRVVAHRRERYRFTVRRVASRWWLDMPNSPGFSMSASKGDSRFAVPLTTEQNITAVSWDAESQTLKFEIEDGRILDMAAIDRIQI